MARTDTLFAPDANTLTVLDVSFSQLECCRHDSLSLDGDSEQLLEGMMGNDHSCSLVSHVELDRVWVVSILARLLSFLGS